MWTVERHGGRSSDSLRLVHKGDDEQKARDKFKALADNLRQGEVILTHNGAVVGAIRAYRTRSRW